MKFEKQNNHDFSSLNRIFLEFFKTVFFLLPLAGSRTTAKHPRGGRREAETARTDIADTKRVADTKTSTDQCPIFNLTKTKFTISVPTLLRRPIPTPTTPTTNWRDFKQSTQCNTGTSSTTTTTAGCCWSWHSTKPHKIQPISSHSTKDKWSSVTQQ